MSLLEIRDLKKYFPVGDGLFSRKKGNVKAVDGVLDGDGPLISSPVWTVVHVASSVRNWRK